MLVSHLRHFVRLSFPLALGLGLCFGTAAQAASAKGARDVVVDSSSDLLNWPVPFHHNLLQPDARLIAAFVRPWLFDSQIFNASGSVSTKSTRILPEPKTHKLTPDPLNWSLSNTSPDEDDYAYVPNAPRTGYVNTAQRMGELSSGHPVATHVPAKYDPERIGDRQVGEGINFYSIEKEMALGRELSLQVEQSARLLTDPVITEYVNRTGQLLVQHSDCKVPFVIKVVDDDEVNAFALPGGFFYVNTGVILAADDEAEFAGVMAHEIAHVCARHATRNLTKGEITQYASLPLIFFGGPVGYAIRQISNIAAPLSILKFSRDAEREADLLGMEYQYAAGYDPTAFVDFFEKLEGQGKESHNFVARAFMTHPMTADRVRRAEATLEMLPNRDSYITDTSEFDEIRDRLSRLTHGHAFQGGVRAHPTLRRRHATE